MYFYFLKKLKRKGDFSSGMNEKAIRTAKKGYRESRSVQFVRVVQKLVFSLI